MLGWVHVSLEPYAVVTSAGRSLCIITSSAPVCMRALSVVHLIEWESVSVLCTCVLWVLPTKGSFPGEEGGGRHLS